MGAIAAATLRRGLRAGDGAWERRAELRPLREPEEAELLAGEDLSPAERATLLLARAVERVGSIEPFGAAEARGLSAGDRNALLLHLHRLCVGDRIDATVTCPAAGCGERLELGPPVEALLVPPDEEVRAEVEVELGPGRARIRPVTGADLEDAAAVAAVDRDGAIALVLERCVEPAAGAARGFAAALAEPDRAAVETALGELDPQAELVMRAACPACGRAVWASLDPGEHVWEVLARRARERHREVHLLALNYHWSEREIMALGPARRRAYLELLDGSPA